MVERSWCGCVRLREIPEDDMYLPSQALRCRLDGVSAGTKISQKETFEAMWEILAGRALLAIVKVRLQGGLLTTRSKYMLICNLV